MALAQQRWLAKSFLATALAATLVASALGDDEAGASRRSLPLPAALVGLAELPAEARTTERLVRAGGPFPFPKDGATFANRERLLPNRNRGYYREYTVAAPGARNRGARRMVCGGVQPTAPDACFYTDDHYASFRRLAQ